MGVFKKQGNWWIDFYHEGKRIRRKVGPSKKVAEMALADIQVKKSKNDFLGVCEPKKVIFRDYSAEYLAYSKANKAKRSYERDILTLEGHVLELWGDQQLGHITPKMIEEYKAQRLQHVVAATVNREIDTIKNMLRKAVEWGYLKNSPGEFVKKLKTGTPHFRYLSGEETKKLLDACRRSDNPHLYPFVVAALNTGMRLGELTAVEWKDIDFKRGILRVDNKKDHHTKNYRVRTIPMNEFLMQVLRKLPRRLDSSYVFQRKDGSKFHKMRSGFENAVKRSGIPHVRFHDLRHTFASHLVMGGVDIRTVQELLGHRDIRMTMRYSHLAPDHMRKAVNVLDYEKEESEALSEAQS